eukprot:SAG31_NODE_1295_length_8952_cov_8.332957_1_plen_180_part_00
MAGLTSAERKHTRGRRGRGGGGGGGVDGYVIGAADRLSSAGLLLHQLSGPQVQLQLYYEVPGNLGFSVNLAPSVPVPRLSKYIKFSSNAVVSPPRPLAPPPPCPDARVPAVVYFSITPTGGPETLPPPPPHCCGAGPGESPPPSRLKLARILYQYRYQCTGNPSVPKFRYRYLVRLVGS